MIDNEKLDSSILGKIKSFFHEEPKIQVEEIKRVEGKRVITELRIPDNGGSIDLKFEDGEEQTIDCPYTRTTQYQTAEAFGFTLSLIALSQQQKIKELSEKVEYLTNTISTLVENQELSKKNENFKDQFNLNTKEII